MPVSVTQIPSRHLASATLLRLDILWSKQHPDKAGFIASSGFSSNDIELKQRNVSFECHTSIKIPRHGKEIEACWSKSFVPWRLSLEGSWRSLDDPQLD